MSQSDQKFFFDMNNFDDDVIDRDLIEEEEEDLPPPPPTFSEAELAAAKKQAYEEGHAAGIKEVETSRAQALANLMQKLTVDMQVLFASEYERQQAYEREVVALSLAIFEQAFPAYHAHHGLDELTMQLREVLQSQQGQNQIEIRVSEEYAKGVEAFIEKLKAQNSDLRCTVIGDATLTDGTFKLAWDDGGAFHDTHAIAQRITSKLNEILATDGTTSHDEGVEDSHQAGDLSSNTTEHDHNVRSDTDDTPHTGDNPIAEENDE